MTTTISPGTGPHSNANPLSRHHHNCYGCGPGNAAGFRIDFTRTDDEAVGSLLFNEQHQGAPGIAHGGVVAAALDEAAGSVLMLLGLPAVTARLDVSFHAPVPLARPVTVRARLKQRQGRKLHIEARIEVDGGTAAEAIALFIVVPATHFFTYGTSPGDMPALGV